MTEETKSPVPAAIRTSIEDQWRQRAQAQGLRPKSAAYRTREVEFFVGAMSALVASGHEIPAYWSMAIMSGRPVVAELAKEHA